MLIEAPHLLQPPSSGAPKATLSGEVFGTLINLSGRRRFTSQRIVLYAVLAASGQAGALDVARMALSQFREAHTLLVEGKGELPGVFSNDLRAAYYGDMRGDKQINGFMALADQTLATIEAKSGGTALLLDELTESATPLLDVLNQLTLLYEQEARRHAIAARQRLLDIMTSIETIARHAYIVSFNAQVIAARSGQAGREFSVVATELISITKQIDELVKAALGGPAT